MHTPTPTACSDPAAPLRYPPGYPPTGARERFFIGVRWLGPDLSFFGRLYAQQKARSAELLNLWGGGARQQAARTIGAIFMHRLHWPGPYFLPDDAVEVIGGGPRFASLGNEGELERTIHDIHASLGITMPARFWQAAGTLTLGELVDALLTAVTAAAGGAAPAAD